MQRSIRVPDNMLYVNPDCALQILIDYIKEELSIQPNGYSCCFLNVFYNKYVLFPDEIDFCNLNGDLIHIEDSEPATNAMNIFKPYLKYICVMKHSKFALFSLIFSGFILHKCII